MKKILFLTALAFASMPALADGTDVTTFKYAGPYAISRPVLMDSVDVNSAQYRKSSLLSTPLDLKTVENGKAVSQAIIAGQPTDAIHLLGFTLSNSIYTTADISVKCSGDYNLYVDGKQITGGHVTLSPAVHKVVVKCLTESGAAADTVSVSYEGKNLTAGTLGEGKRTYTLDDVLEQKLYTAANVSPDGRWMISSTYQMQQGGAEKRENFLWNLANGTRQKIQSTRWMPRTSKYLISRKESGQTGYTLVAVDPATQQETVLTEMLPNNSFTMSPTEDFVIYSEVTEGPKEKKDVYEVVTPDDRQPGWRNRTNIFKFDLKTGMVQQLTYGYHNVYLNDISNDGKKLLISSTRYDASKMRPTDFTSLYVLDLTTMKLDTIFTDDGFASGGQFSPDAKQVLVQGSPEAFGGIGLNIAEGQTASMYDYQLFLINLDNPSRVIPLTKDFNPSVSSAVWSNSDGQIYVAAEDKDCKNLFRINPKTLKISKIAIPEDMIDRWTVSSAAPLLAWYGESAVNGNRLYTLNTKTLKNTLLEDISKNDLSNVELGECHPFTWVNPEGDSICCRYYLPPHFDSSKQYPMIVNYYGGCSPTSRSFGGRYSSQAYSALGYIVLIVNPRGATGFGQKWSAAHVNTAGQGVAEDIIGATKAFCAEHSYVNAKKIGCIGASYGGFMTQYLQTVTDIFAAAVSHAGISDHTSYWGEGYWGYSYSQTSMANSYPWTRKDLYVDQSPLFRADKIHTPLLFVHGTGDTNVPVGESIQMYTALKLLNRPTAMVLVEGENHWIMDYQKRIKWQNTIWAWFARYLQDDSSWWDSMYGHKDL